MMKDSSKRQASVRLLALCLGTSAMLIAPSAALGADLGTGGTVRATIGDNGAVKSVKQVGANGATSAFSGSLPIKMTISRAGQTYTYHVENTFTKTQTVHFTDTAGADRHTTVTLQLPLVAQLGVDVPTSMTNLSAPGAAVTTGANGVRHLLWNMVLFAPLGSSAQDVTFSAAGNGSPVAELRATPVDPTNTAGLSATSTDKTAEFQQEDFWAGYAGGGNDGLGKLSAGTGKILDGLNQLLAGAAQLHSGLADGLSGTQQAADGSTLLYQGSKTLHAGLGKIAAGQGDLTTGLGKITAGQGQLTTGLSQINVGQGALTDGLAQISGGLAQLNDPVHGLPAAIPGIQALIDGIGNDTTSHTLLNGVTQLVAGIGDDATVGTLLNGVAQVQGGLGLLKTGIQQNAGCAANVLGIVSAGTLGVAPGANPCAPSGLPGMPGLDPASAAVVGSLIAQFNAVAAGTDPTLTAAFGGLDGGLTAIHGGLAAMKAGLSSGSLAAPGIKEGLQLTQGGLGQLKAGVQQAVDGIALLAPGAASALDGSQKLTAGSGAALSGSQALVTGDKQALAGSKKLLAGTKQTVVGTGNGPKQLTGGLKLLSDGLVAGAKSFPAAVDGAGQIADGLGQVVPGEQQVKDGLDQVQSGATGPLQTQLEQASRNAHQQIAVLNAAAGLSSQAPGGAGTSYVLAQPGAIALAANATSSNGSSHTGRNAALIAIGGVLALAIGVGAGMAMGRQRVSA
jgi:putative membrane protein